MSEDDDKSQHWRPNSMRIRVTAEELKTHWFSTESASMIHDHSTQEIVVVMHDGTQYACTFAEHARLRATE